MTEILISGIFSRMLSLKDEQERVQKKTFTKWINCYLTQLKPPVLIKDIYIEFSDGLLLLELLEILTKTKLKKEKPRSMQRIHCITNVKTALEFMEIEKKIKMVNINPSDIVDGKPAIVLGLMWTLILFFQIEVQEEFLLHALGLENDPSAKVKGLAKKALMAWSNNALSEKYGLNLKDFGESWRDGKAFNALVHNINPDLIDMDSLKNKTNRENLENAFNIAENELGIPKLLDSEDVDVQKPDEKSIMTYVAQFLKSYPEGKKSEGDIVAIEDNGILQNSEPIISNWEKIKEFKDHLKHCMNDEFLRNDYEVFLKLMKEKKDAEEAIYDLKKEGENEKIIKEVVESLNESELKLKEWKSELDQKLPGELGSLIVNWLYEAESFFKNPIENYSSKDIDEKLKNRIKNHEQIFSKKDNVIEKLNNILNKALTDVFPEQLKDIERRVDNVLRKEAEEQELLKIFFLKSKLNEESNKWNNSLDYWNTPISSQEDFNKRMLDFNVSSDNGNPIDYFNNDLDTLIKNTTIYLKSHPGLEPSLENFLKDSLDNLEKENDILPTKFEMCCKKFEDLSNKMEEMDEIDTKIKNYMNKIKNSMKNKDVEQQILLSNQLPDIKDLLRIQGNIFNENLKVHCNETFCDTIKKKINEDNETLQNMEEEIVKNIETQEQEKVIQLQATKNATIKELRENCEKILSEINTWFEDVENDYKQDYGCSYDDLMKLKKHLNELEEKRPKIQKLFDNGYGIVEDLDSQESPKESSKLREMLEESQKKLNEKEFKDLSNNIDNLIKIIDAVKDVEEGIETLSELVEEGTKLKYDLQNVQNNEDSIKIMNKQKEFLDKKIIINSKTSNNKELLDKLKEISKDCLMTINLDPLEKKSMVAEENIRDLLKNSKNFIKARNKCEDAYNTVSSEFETITEKFSEINNSYTDELSKKKSMEKLLDLEKDIIQTENKISQVMKLKESEEQNLDKIMVKNIEQGVNEMKNKSVEINKKLIELKEDVGNVLQKWNDFNHLKGAAEHELEEVLNEMKEAQSDRNSSDGGSCEEKKLLLTQNEEVLNKLVEQQNAFKEIMNLAKDLKSEEAINEIKELNEKVQSAKNLLDNEIACNEKDLKNHQQFESKLNLYRNLLAEAELVNKDLKETSNTKEGLLKKKNLFEKLNNLKAPCEIKLNNLKNIEKNILNENALKSQNQIFSEVKKELEKFQNIFGDIKDSNDKINKNIIKLEKLEDQCDEIIENFKKINKDVEEILKQPKNTVNEKDKLNHELLRITKIIDEEINKIKDFKIESKELSEEATNELSSKMKNVENQLLNTYQYVNEELSQNKLSIDQQSNLEKNLKSLDSTFKMLEEKIHACSIPTKDKTSTEDNVKKLKNLKDELEITEDLIQSITNERNEAIPYMTKSELNKINNQIQQICNNATTLQNSLEESQNNLQNSVEKWNNFNEAKDVIEEKLKHVVKDLEKAHDKRQGIHGNDCEDKALLLKENEDRLNCLLNQEVEVDKMIALSKELKSEVALQETTTLKKICLDQQEDIKNEITSNRKDLENHKEYINALNEFQSWMEATEELNQKIAQSHNTKEGLLLKQDLLEKLQELKSDGNSKIKDLQTLQNTIIKETAPKSEKQILCEVNKELERFNVIFEDIDNSTDDIKETVLKMKNIEEKTEQLTANLENINDKIEKSLTQPKNSIMDKKDFGKILKNLTEFIDENKKNINELKNNSNELTDEAKEEMIIALEKLENNFEQVEKDIQEEILQNEKAINCQSKLEGNLNDLDLFIKAVQNNMAKCSVPTNNKEDIEENLGSLKDLEIELLITEDMIKNILEVRSESVKHLNKAELNEIDKNFEKIENNLNDQRNAITKAKSDFDFDLKKWEKFNQIRDDIKNDLNIVIEELEKCQVIRKSVHGGDLEDKAELLKTKETRYNELINQEEEIENMISLAKELNSYVPLEEMENLKKSWNEEKDKIEKEINQNRKDLEDHKCLQNKLIAFKEWMKNSKELNKQIEDLPNNKEGLLKKQNLLEKMKELKSSGNNFVKDLKNYLSIVLSETAPDFKDKVSSEVNQEVEKFNATFGDVDNSNYDIMETISELKKLEEKCDKIKENVNDMERKIEQSLQLPKDSIADKEKLEKELNRSIRITEQLLSEIKELKNETDNLNHDAKEEVISKLTQLETQLIQNHQQIIDEVVKNKELIIQQSKLEDNLKQLAFIIEEVENNVSKYSIPTNNVKNNQEKLNKLKDLENDLKTAESMIIKLDEENMNMQSSSEHDNIDEMKEKANNLRNIFEESKENVKIELNQWNVFIDKKENIQEKLKNISKEVEDNHVLRKGVHGGDCKDKEKLVKENELRFNDLLKQEKDFEEIKKLAEKLNSETSLREVEELENMYQEEKMSLKKELIQNQKDLKDHLYLQEELNLFKEWFKDIEGINAEIEETPDSKEGLKSKQNLFEKINTLRSPGENKIKDLKNLLNNVLNNTASDYKTQLTSELKNEFDKFQEIFRNIDINDDNFNDVMSKLEKLEEGCEDICGNIEDINIELQKCLDDPRNTIEEKEKFEKELGQFNRLVDQQRSQIKELMNESEKLNNETKEEVLKKLQNVERNLNDIQHQIKEELSQNKKSKGKQLALEKKLDNLESFILQFEDHIAECSVPAENEIVVEENLKKIEKLKNQIPLAKNLLEEILKTKNQFNSPEQCLKSCDYAEQKFFGVEEEIINLEKTLEMSKNNWTTFNSDKEDLESWIDSVNLEMLNIFEKNQGIHGGRFEDKEKVLDSHRNLLQDVINHEVEIKGLIDRSTPLSTTPNTDSPKRITNTLCKKYEKVLETLTNIVQENQIDLEKHENFENEIDKFCSENNKILKELNEKISNEPNNEDGLKKKAELYDEIKTRYNQRAKLLPELEKMKEDLLLHSSPKAFQKIEETWDIVVDSFTKSFSKSHENQLKLLATVGSLEQTNSNFENIENRLNNLETNREECIRQPISTIEDAEKILNDLKHLRYEVSDLQSSIDQISRKTNELPMIKDKVEKIQKQHKSLKENLDKDINQYENINKELQNFSSSIKNLRTWLDHSLMVFKEQSILDNVDSDSLRTKHSKVKQLLDSVIKDASPELSKINTQLINLGSQLSQSYSRELSEEINVIKHKREEIENEMQNHIKDVETIMEKVQRIEQMKILSNDFLDEMDDKMANDERTICLEEKQTFLQELLVLNQNFSKAEEKFNILNLLNLDLLENDFKNKKIKNANFDVNEIINRKTKIQNNLKKLSERFTKICEDQFELNTELVEFKEWLQEHSSQINMLNETINRQDIEENLEILNNFLLNSKRTGQEKHDKIKKKLKNVFEYATEIENEDFIKVIKDLEENLTNLTLVSKEKKNKIAKILEEITVKEELYSESKKWLENKMNEINYFRNIPNNLNEKRKKREELQELKLEIQFKEKEIQENILSNDYIEFEKKEIISNLITEVDKTLNKCCTLIEESIDLHKKFNETFEDLNNKILTRNQTLKRKLDSFDFEKESMINIECIDSKEDGQFEAGLEKLKELCYQIKSQPLAKDNSFFEEDVSSVKNMLTNLHSNSVKLKEKENEFSELNNKFENDSMLILSFLDESESTLKRLSELQGTLHEKFDFKNELVNNLLPEINEKQKEIDNFKELCYDFLQMCSDRNKSKLSNDIFYRFSNITRTAELLTKKVQKAEEDHRSFENKYKITKNYLKEINENIMAKLCLVNDKSCTIENLRQMAVDLGGMELQNEEIIHSVQEVESYSHVAMELTNKSGREHIRNEMMEINELCSKVLKSISCFRSNIDTTTLAYTFINDKITKMEDYTEEIVKKLNERKFVEMDLNKKCSTMIWLKDCEKEINMQKNNLRHLLQEPVNEELEEKIKGTNKRFQDCLEIILQYKNEIDNQVKVIREYEYITTNVKYSLEQIEKELEILIKPYNCWDDMENRISLLSNVLENNLFLETKRNIEELYSSVEKHRGIVNETYFQSITDTVKGFTIECKDLEEKMENIDSANAQIVLKLKEVKENAKRVGLWLRNIDINQCSISRNNDKSEVLNKLESILDDNKKHGKDIDTLFSVTQEITNSEDGLRFSVICSTLITEINNLRKENHIMEQNIEKTQEEIHKYILNAKLFEEKMDIFTNWLNGIQIRIGDFQENSNKSQNKFELIKSELRHGQEFLNDLNDFLLSFGINTKGTKFVEDLAICRESYAKVKDEVNLLLKELNTYLANVQDFEKQSGSLQRWLQNAYEYLDRYLLKKSSKTLSENQMDFENVKTFSAEVNEKDKSFEQLKECKIKDVKDIEEKTNDLYSQYNELKKEMYKIISKLELSLSGQKEMKIAMSEYLESLAQAKIDFDNTREVFDDAKDGLNGSKLRDLMTDVSDKVTSFNRNLLSTHLLEVIKYAGIVQRSGQDLENLAIDQKERCEREYEKMKENWTDLLKKLSNAYNMVDKFQKDMLILKDWNEHSKKWHNNLRENDEHVFEFNETSQILRNLQILQDDIASHKVNLSRLQSQIEPLMKITHDRALENSVEELSSDYKELHNQCQNSIDKYDALVKLMNKYENSTTSVLNWIDTSTQVLLKCSDFNMNNSQIRSKLLMIENIEKDLEMSGQLKFIEAMQHGEELINELCGMGRNIIERQVNDLSSDWTEICRQINHLLNNLKSVASRNEAFKETINNLSLWLDNMEHVGMTESSVVDHHCIKPLDNKTKSGQYDRVKTLLVEVERKKPEFEKLRNIALEMGNPSFDLENSQLQTRFNKLQNNLKEKVDKLEKQETDFDKIKQNMENIEKWIFQTSIKFINENIEQNDNNVSVDDDLDTVLEQNNRIIQSITDKEPEVIQVREEALNLLNNLRSQSTEEVVQFQEDIDKMESNFNNLKTTSVNKKQNLLENLDKWKNYQRLLESTKHFLDNDFQRWIQEQDLSTAAISLENNNKTKELQEIENMEQKIVNMKRNVEKAAHECDGIPPKLSNVLSRSQTPNLKFYKNSPIPSPMLRPSSAIPEYSNRTGQSSPKSELSYKPKIIFEQLEDNLLKLSRQKKEVQDKYADWNTFNREKSAFKNWFDNEVVKYESTLQSSPKMTNIDKFQRNKIKNIQDEMLSKKPVLMNLMNRFEEISSSTASKDLLLRNMFQEFGKMENEITKLLNREDKEVEADFTEDESKADLIEDIYVPKLSLNTERYMSPETSNRFIQTFSTNNVPTNANFSCQTPSTKKTQTIFEDSKTEPSDYDRQCLKSSKKDQLFNIACKISEIRSELDKTKLPSDRGSSPVYLSSRRLRLPNQESVRRNIIPSPSRRANHSKDYSSLENNNGHVPYHSNSVLEISSPSSLHNRDLDEYVPAKDKWHDLEVFLQSTPRISESIQRQHPNREFQVSYQSPSGKNGKKSRRSNIYDELKKLTKDSKDLRSMDRDLID